MAPTEKKSSTNGASPTEKDSSTNGAFSKVPTYDAMAGSLTKHGADHRIHGSMTADQNPESLKKLYDEFASEYDGAYDAMLYESPDNIAKCMVETIGAEFAKTAKILDAGCGTGKVGQCARKIVGPDAFIHGIDLSTEMLNVARNKKVYNELGEANLMAKIDLESNSFDATVSTGVFTAGHVKKEGIIELARVTRAGGYIFIGCQELVFESEGYVTYLEELKKKGVAELETIQRSFTMKKAGTEMNILVIRVLS